MTTTIDDLIKKRTGMLAYMQLKIDAYDLHGVADAAMDLREIQAQIDLMIELNNNGLKLLKLQAAVKRWLTGNFIISDSATEALIKAVEESE